MHRAIPHTSGLVAAVLLTLCASAAVASVDYYCTGDGHSGYLTVNKTGMVVNKYAQVTTKISAGDSTIAISSAASFKAKDLIMVHQTTGYSMLSSKIGDQTTIDVSKSTLGQWELARVKSVSGSTLTLEESMVKSFPATYTQVVLVPEYTNVMVTKGSSVVAGSWDGKTGGILAFLVQGIIDNRGDISAHGTGFRGGQYVNETVFTPGCTALSGPKPPATVKTGQYAQRGEGIATGFYGTSETGRGNAANAGGGGNCSNSGGGGGGNGGKGGKGGRSWYGDNSRDVGGYGGSAVTYTVATHLMFGGAGGAGHGDNNYGSHGGRGGGIVFVRAQKLIGTGVVDANGRTGVFANMKFNYDGQGGGGAGGTVLLRLRSTATCLSVESEGANGLDMKYHNAHGPGGGGGGGRVFFQSLTGGVCKTDVTGGVAGKCVNIQNNCSGVNHGAVAGGNGVLEKVPTKPFSCDQDNDCIPDVLEGGKDTDKDGIPDYKDTDSDNDGLPDKLEDKNCNGKKDPGETDPKDPDTDKDGLKDGWTDKNGNGKWDKGEGEDQNNNGKVDTGETDPLKWDTDGGCASDGAEELTAKTDPLDAKDDKCGTKKDTDGDKLPDEKEDKNGNGKKDPGETDPLNKDTDGDGLIDGWVDTNGNGKWDKGEGEDPNLNAQVDKGETDPLKWDTDGDCESDGDEELKLKTDPLNGKDNNSCNKDTDGDKLPDKIEDKNGNGKWDPGETDWENPDTDGDGLKDGTEDGDLDGKRDSDETDPLNPDTDGDGLKDGWKDKNGNGKWDPGEGEDKNNNGKVDKGETDPLKWDTDGGCESDGAEELVTGHDPLDPKDDTCNKKDTDGDGLLDTTEDKNNNGKVDPGETDPKNPDTDGDGLTDGWVDKNKNGKWDKGEGEDRNNNGKQDTGETDPLKKDTDGGCEDDGSEELVTGHDPLNPKDDKCKNNGGGDGGVDAGGGGLYFYGSGCSMGGSEPGPLGLGLLLLGAVLLGRIRHQRRKRASKEKKMSNARRVALPLALALTLAAAPAKADPVEMSVLHFRLAAAPINFFVTEGGQTLPHLVPSAGLYLSYAHRPLQLYNATTEDYEKEIVKYQVNMDLLVAFGLFDRLEIGLHLPVNLSQDADDLGAIGRSPGTTIGAGLGDLRIIPKVRILTKGIFTLGLAAPLSLPTGNEEDFLGDTGVTWTPKAILALNTKYVDVGFNLGFRLRPKGVFQVSAQQGTVIVDDELFVSLGARVPIVDKKFDLIADWYLSMGIDEQDTEEVPTELMLGGRVHLPHGLTANFGAGPGLSKGAGTPVFRLFAGLGYQYQPPPPVAKVIDDDTDKDGIRNKDDLCPNDPEDKDGFEDTDGCPEMDNDNDGIKDTADKCPNVAEDKDGFEDIDGCPDLDNDKDGITDAEDKCPVDPEDRDGHQDTDGCEDRDNDSDGIMDRADQCPMEPETFNGVDDTDGCPDKGKGPVQITKHGRIKVPPVYFATNKDTILKKSYPVLLEVAATIKKNMWIKKVLIEGHTDSRNTDEFNLDLSLRRASSVLRFLIKHGVDHMRLVSQGFGESRPVGTNATRAGRALNRRVDFIILDPKLKK